MPRHSNRVQVWVAEVDRVQKMLIWEYLEYVAPYQVFETQGVYHLLAACKGALRWPAILLLDMEGFHMDGVDLVQEVKRRAPRLPILGMTDRQTELYDHPRLRRHQVSLIQKPFSPFQLHRSLSAALAAQGPRACGTRTCARAHSKPLFLGGNAMNRIALAEILKLSWDQQAESLRGLSRRDTEILWFQIQQHSERVDQLKLALFSILRDLYENAAQGEHRPERGLQSAQAAR